MKWLREEERTNYPLTVSIDDSGEDFLLTVQTQAPVEPERICGYITTALESLTQALESSPATALETLDILPAGERHQLLYGWNETGAEFPHDKCIHELFEEQVERDPDAVAVVFEDTSLSYGELNRRANQLAHHLCSLGVGPDKPVAICVERSLEMIVGLLAILKAGGAYVPLDPSYPEDRIRFMLEDSAPAVLLRQSHLSALFQGVELPMLDVDAETVPWHDRPASNIDAPSIGLTPHHLAYIIYTSGSTGKPKGVMVQHDSLWNRMYGCETVMDLVWR